MLKRNKVLVAFMLVAVLCMAIGFAAISDTLYVAGTVNLNLDDGSDLDNEFNKNVYFVEATNDTTKVTTSTIGTDKDGDEKDLYTFAIDASAFDKVGAEQVVKVSVQNDNNVVAKLTLSTNVDKGALADFITVTPVINATVGANTSTELTITVKLDKVPANTTTSEISFTIDAVPAN